LNYYVILANFEWKVHSKLPKFVYSYKWYLNKLGLSCAAANSDGAAAYTAGVAAYLRQSENKANSFELKLVLHCPSPRHMCHYCWLGSELSGVYAQEQTQEWGPPFVDKTIIEMILQNIFKQEYHHLSLSKSIWPIDWLGP
jgi:hypothetical protein